MSIQFACICGKRLKAKDAMAGRLTYCPACEAPVVIPTGLATHRGAPAASAVELPAVRHPAEFQRRLVRVLPERESTSIERTAPIDEAQAHGPGPAHSAPKPIREVRPDEVFLVPQGQKKKLTYRRRHAETHWSESLIYVIPTSRLLAGLALALALLSAYVVRTLPSSLNVEDGGPLLGQPPVLVAGLLLLVMGYACAVLNDILVLAIEGSTWVISPPNPRSLLRSTAHWIACVIVGPAPVLALAGLFWLHCGDLKFLDWLILAELTVLASTIFLVSLLLVNATGAGPRELDRRAVLAITWSLGWRFVLCGAVLAAATLAWGWFGVFALARLEVSPFEGFAWLLLGWLGALFVGAFGMRRLGLWYYAGLQRVRQARREQRRVRSQPVPADLVRTST